MTLREALVAAAQPSPEGPPWRVHLCCGFEPLHLVPFLKAHTRARLAGKRGVEVATGRFGDLAGNIERAAAQGGSDPVVAVVEWADIDPRLGLREAHRPAENDETSVLEEAGRRFARLEALLCREAAGRRVVLRMPALPLPPWAGGLPGQSPAFALRLDAAAAEFAARCAAGGAIVAASAGSGAEACDFASHLASGFPYSKAYTDVLAAALAGLLLPAPVKKGLVTDLDNTLWLGIVGDDGPQEVAWSLERHARVHGLYQQFLAGLAARGVLVGVASKNDPAVVAEALARPDLLLPAGALFPVEANWGPKSESLRRVAAAWNIGLDAIVFVDDNPLEVAEVRQALPEVECHVFPAASPAEVLQLLEALQRKFARERVGEEDRIRAASLRSAARMQEAVSSADGAEALVAGLEARMQFVFDVEPFDARALELLNKTNQFNLNGRRWEESDFRRVLKDPETVLCVASYEDRFGPLGKIGVAVGERRGGVLRLKSWVISCRAFSRRVEFETLRALFEWSGAEELELDWQGTARNGPARETLAALLGDLPEAGLLRLGRAAFEERCPRLYAKTDLVPPSGILRQAVGEPR